MRDDLSPELGAAVAGADRRTLDALFAEPAAHSVAWMDVVRLINSIGAVREGSNNAFVLQIGTTTLDMKKPHTQHLTAPEILGLRRFVAHAGWSPRAPSEAPADPVPPAPTLVVALDPKGARIFRIDLDAEETGLPKVSPYDPEGVLHQVSRKMGEGAQGAGAERAVFERIDQAAALGGRIVVVGGQTGEATSAHALAERLRARHPSSYGRIVREAVAGDVADLTGEDLFKIARRALGATSEDKPRG